MQLITQRQVRVAEQQRRSNRSCGVGAHVRRGVVARGPARLIAGSRRPAVRVQAEVQTATATSKAIEVGTIALRKAIAQATYKGTNIFVTGGQGELAVRVIRDLLKAGFKVTAAVSDLDAANAAFAFFKRYGLIDRAVAANLKLVAAASLESDEAAVKALPKRAKILVIEGDVEGKGKTGAKEVDFALALAAAASASQVILVSTATEEPAASGRSVGFLGGLFGGAAAKAPADTGAPVEQLGKLEQKVAESGLPYTIIRAYGTDRTEEGSEPGPYIAVGVRGSTPTSAVASKSQAASVVAEVLKAAGPTNELVFELSASAAEQRAVADSVGEIIAAAEAVAAEASAEEAEEAAKTAAPSGLGLFNLGTMSVLRKASVTVVEEDADSAPAEPSAPETPIAKLSLGPGLFSFGAKKPAVTEPEASGEEAVPEIGTRSARRAAAARQKEQEEVAVVEKPAEKAGTGFFGFGTAKVAVKQPEPVNEEEEPPKKAGNGFFAFGKVSATKPEPAKEEQEVVVVEEVSKKAGTGFFGFGTAKISARKPEPKEEEEEEPPKKAGAGFFSFGTAKVSAKKPEPKEAEEEEPPKKAGTGFFSFGTAKVSAKKPEPKEEEEAEQPKKAGTRFFSFGTAKISAKKPEPEEEEDEEPPKKAGTGFFSFGAGRVAVKKAEEVEKAPLSPSKRAATPPPRARATPPAPEPAPKRGAAPARRAPEPAPAPAPPKRAAPVRARAAEPEPPKKAAAPSIPTRSGTTASRSVPASPSTSASRTSTTSSNSRTPSGSSSRSSNSNSSGTSSRSTRPAPESAPTYVPGTRGARLAAQKEQEQQQRRK